MSEYLFDQSYNESNMIIKLDKELEQQKCELAELKARFKDIKNNQIKNNTVMIVYAFNPNSNSNPWIYGVYQNYKEGFEKMKEMEDNKDYQHLVWSNNIKEIKGDYK